MTNLTPELDKAATHTALRLRNNELSVQTWTEALGLDPEEVKDAPSPTTWGRLKFYLTSQRAA